MSLTERPIVKKAVSVFLLFSVQFFHGFPMQGFLPVNSAYTPDQQQESNDHSASVEIELIQQEPSSRQTVSLVEQQQNRDFSPIDYDELLKDYDNIDTHLKHKINQVLIPALKNIAADIFSQLPGDFDWENDDHIKILMTLLKKHHDGETYQQLAALFSCEIKSIEHLQKAWDCKVALYDRNAQSSCISHSLLGGFSIAAGIMTAVVLFILEMYLYDGASKANTRGWPVRPIPPMPGGPKCTGHTCDAIAGAFFLMVLSTLIGGFVSLGVCGVSEAVYCLICKLCCPANGFERFYSGMWQKKPDEKIEKIIQKALTQITNCRNVLSKQAS